MSFICRTKTFLRTAPAIGPFSFGALFAISAGLLVGSASTANAMAVPAFPYVQGIDEEDIKVMVQKLGDDGEEIEVVVLADDDSSQHGIAKKVIRKHLGQLQEDGDNVEVEVLVHADGETGDHKDTLKKLKSKLNGRLHKIIANPDENIEVVVLDELQGKHKAHLHKLMGDTDGKNNVFVFEADGESGNHAHLHKHLIEILHGPESGKMSRKALAKKLRQLADQIESGDVEHSASDKTSRKIKVIHSGDHELHLKEHGKNKDDDQQAFEFTTKSGKHIVIGKPGQAKSMVLEVQTSEGESDEQSNDSDGKKVRWHTKKSPEGAKNIFVEKLHMDADHDPKELAQKILGKIKSSDSKHNVVIEKILKGNDKKAKAGGSNSFVWKSAPGDMESSLQELRNELKELRRELKELKADRKRD